MYRSSTWIASAVLRNAGLVGRDHGTSDDRHGYGVIAMTKRGAAFVRGVTSLPVSALQDR